MGRGGRLEFCQSNGYASNFDLGVQWMMPEGDSILAGGLFACIGHNDNMGLDGAVSSNAKSVSSSSESLKIQENLVEEEEKSNKRKKNHSTASNRRPKLKIKVRNPSIRRLVSGAIAGAVSRTAVAPLETIRTHLMVGNIGNSTAQVFNNVIKSDGWKGLFRGNLVNVIRVAPSKAIELFTYDTINKSLSSGEKAVVLPVPASLVAGACAGACSTICTYPLELVKTRLTIQRGVYNDLLDAFMKILSNEGPAELYRGLVPSLIGVIPYAATNYFAYDTLRNSYKKICKKQGEKIGNIETLLIGSAAGTISSSITFPLEVARKQMQAGAVSGRKVYRNMFHALTCIVEQEGFQGLCRGLGPSCLKLVPAAGISFMCYELCKQILVDSENEEEQ